MGELLGLFFLLGGLFFSVIGVFGLIRFPDVYSRIHSSGKVSTLGLVGMILGTAFLVPAATLKLIALSGFLIITAPVASHTIANAAYRSGVPMHNPVRDDLGGQIHPAFEPVLDVDEQTQ